MGGDLIGRVMLIDDDDMNNAISTLIIKKVDPQIDIQQFTDSRKGLSYLAEEYRNSPLPTLLLLDINMPVLNGWDVLQQLESYPSDIKSFLKIYMLSSSVNPTDRRRAAGLPLVSGFLERPLTTDNLQAILSPGTD